MTDPESSDLQRFEDLDVEIRREYAYASLAKWKAAETSLGRSVLAMILLAAIFELVNRGLVTKIDIAGIELQDARFINVFLLIVFSYQVSVFAELAAEVDWASRSYEESIKSFLHEGSHWWWGALTPGGSVVTGIMRQDFLREELVARITYVFQVIRTLLFMAWPMVFAIYGYTQLFLHYSPIWLVFLSMIASAILIVFAGFALFSAPSY